MYVSPKLYKIQDEKILRGNSSFKVLEAQKAGVRFTTHTIKKLNDEYSEVQARFDSIHQDIVKEIVSIASIQWSEQKK